MLKERDKVFLILGSVVGAVLLTVLLILLVLPKEEPVPETEPTTLPTTSPYLDMAFYLDGDYLTCATRESILGIDVSNHQGDVDWQQVRSAGVQFVFLRIGYRGNAEGNLYEDERAQQNYKGAKEAGLLIGGYFYAQAVSVEEAVEEANFALELTKDWEFDLPLVYDWEYSGDNTRVAQVDRETVTQCTAAFCQTVEAAGRKSMVYCNPWQYRDLLDMEAVGDIPLWYAQYTDTPTLPKETLFWQYTETGFVPGISTNVDIDLYFPPKPLA